MLTWNFLTKSIFLSHQHYLIRASEWLRIVYHPSQSFWKAEEGGKKRRNFRWSHVRLDSCAAHFRMEQAHLFSCWLPALKSPEDRSAVRTHAAPSVSYYRLLLSTSLSFILLDKKWQTHFFVHDVFRFICQIVEENLTPGQGADSRGTFGRRKQQLMNGFKWKVVVRA